MSLRVIFLKSYREVGRFNGLYVVSLKQVQGMSLQSLTQANLLTFVFTANCNLVTGWYFSTFFPEPEFLIMKMQI